MLWPLVSVPIDLAQPGACASVTATSVSVVVPVFFTVIVKFAVPPESIACDFGSFVIEIEGLSTSRCSLSSELQGLVAPLLLASPLYTACQ